MAWNLRQTAVSPWAYRVGGSQLASGLLVGRVHELVLIARKESAIGMLGVLQFFYRVECYWPPPQAILITHRFAFFDHGGAVRRLEAIEPQPCPECDPVERKKSSPMVGVWEEVASSNECH